MGHASASTLSTYAHLRPTAEDRTRAAASDMAASVLASYEDAVSNKGDVTSDLQNETCRQSPADTVWPCPA